MNYRQQMFITCWGEQLIHSVIAPQTFGIGCSDERSHHLSIHYIYDPITWNSIMDFRKDIAFDKLFKVSPIGINIVDLQSRRLIETSSWVVNHIGYTQEEFAELSNNLFESIIHPDDRESQLAAYKRLQTDPTLLFTECQLRYRKKNGEYIPALVRLSVLDVDDHKIPKTALSTAIDITEILVLRERLQAELKKIDIISFKNSHELRGPVATILGLIQLIDYQGMGGGISVEIIDALRETVKKLDQVIREITEHTA